LRGNGTVLFTEKRLKETAQLVREERGELPTAKEDGQPVTQKRNFFFKAKKKRRRKKYVATGKQKRNKKCAGRKKRETFLWLGECTTKVKKLHQKKKDQLAGSSTRKKSAPTC